MTPQIFTDNTGGKEARQSCTDTNSGESTRARLGNKERKVDLVSQCLQPLKNAFEAIQAGLTHPIQRVGSPDLAEVGRSTAARGVEDVCLAVHILHHEELPLESNLAVFTEQDIQTQHFRSFHSGVH